MTISIYIRLVSGTEDACSVLRLHTRDLPALDVTGTTLTTVSDLLFRGTFWAHRQSSQSTVSNLHTPVIFKRQHSL